MRQISSSQSHTFRHPKLTDHEMTTGCKPGIDSYADTSVAGKHAHVIEFVDGREVTAKSWNNEKTHNLKIANVAYAYDSPNGQVFILIVNQSIYGGHNMTDSLLQPIQCLQNGIHINTNPKRYFKDDPKAQTISFDDVSLPLEFNGPLPFIHVRRPTKSEFDNCSHFELTSHDEWDPYNPSSAINMIKTESSPDITSSQEVQLMSDICAISSELMCGNYFPVLDDYREVYRDNTSTDDFSY